MKKPEYFKPWINGWQWGIRITVWLILISALVQFGAFALTQNYLVSLLGAQPEDVSFALLITYVGILATLPIQFRFLRFFETRSYLLFNILAGIMLNIACTFIDNLIFFYIIRFFQGVIVCTIAGCMLTMIFSRLNTEKMQAIGSSVFYGSILASGILVGLLAAVVVTTADWKKIYLYLIIFQAFTLLLVFISMKPKAGFKSYPLYQIDWTGATLLTLGATSLAYMMIYGSKYYWLSDSRIAASALLAIIGITLYIFRLHLGKRPMVNLAVLGRRNFLIGLILLALYYGLKDSINLIYSYTAAILQWSTLQLVYLALINLAGIVVFMIFSAQLIIRKRHSTKFFLLVGFSAMLIYHLYIYYILTPDLAFTDLMLPIFLHGAASGLLFVPIVIFIMSSAPPNTGTTGIVVAAYTRFTTALFSVAGFYNLQLYFTQYYKDGFLKHLSAVDFAATERINNYKQVYMQKGFTVDQANGLATAAVNRATTIQTQLLSNKAIFLLFALIILCIIIMVVILPSINKTYIHWSKRMFVLKRG